MNYFNAFIDDEGCTLCDLQKWGSNIKHVSHLSAIGVNASIAKMILARESLHKYLSCSMFKSVEYLVPPAPENFSTVVAKPWLQE